MTIGEQIKRMRKNRHLSQVDLCRASGLKQSRISQIEDPKYDRMTLQSLRRVAEALNCDIKMELIPRVNLRIKTKVATEMLGEQASS